jgi:hypothetical protein
MSPRLELEYKSLLSHFLQQIDEIFFINQIKMAVFA